MAVHSVAAVEVPMSLIARDHWVGTACHPQYAVQRAPLSQVKIPILGPHLCGSGHMLKTLTPITPSSVW